MRPRLRFSPWAWAKLLFLRDRGPTEIAAFGISPRDDLLFVEDLQLPRQRCSPLTAALEDVAVADLFDAQVDKGRSPAQFARIWVHTHPGDSAQPSGTDERTFERVFGACDWAVMFILARGGDAYARLRLQCGVAVSLRLRTEIDYSRPFAGSDFERWEQEYQTAVVPDAAVRLSDDRPSRLFDRLGADDTDSLADLWA